MKTIISRSDKRTEFLETSTLPEFEDDSECFGPIADEATEGDAIDQTDNTED
jgi:hypothetical protein